MFETYKQFYIFTSWKFNFQRYNQLQLSGAAGKISQVFFSFFFLFIFYKKAMGTKRV